MCSKEREKVRKKGRKKKSDKQFCNQNIPEVAAFQEHFDVTLLILKIYYCR